MPKSKRKIKNENLNTIVLPQNVKRICLKVKIPITKTFGKKERLLELLERPKTKEALLFKLKTVKFCQERGVKATVKTFKVSRATVYRWKKEWEKSEENLETLITQVFFRRKRKWHPEVVSFLTELKKLRPELTKTQLKKLCYEFCQKRNLTPPSNSTIKRILKYLEKRESLEKTFV